MDERWVLTYGCDRERSRRAVTATTTGWQAEITNRNGAVLHPWGQAPVLAQRHNTLIWHRVGIRVLSSHEDIQHWVLLEADSINLTGAARLPLRTSPRGPTPSTGLAR
ncbi:MAG: hypothetical protein ACRDQZ_11390 [Mycobacteriales bacterium]